MEEEEEEEEEEEVESHEGGRVDPALYRRYVARLEMRRRYTWNIFQSIDMEEQDQLQLLDPVVDPWLDRETCYDLIPVPGVYTGPRLSFPLSISDTNPCSVRLRSSRYFLQLLYETKKLLKQMPNIIHLSTSCTKEITICEVDRVVVLLFAYLLLYPDYMHLNRGNHEDHIMNLRWDIFSLLPAATVIDGKILIVHGGISDQTDLTSSLIERHKVKSALRFPRRSLSIWTWARPADRPREEEVWLQPTGQRHLQFLLVLVLVLLLLPLLSSDSILPLSSFLPVLSQHALHLNVLQVPFLDSLSSIVDILWMTLKPRRLQPNTSRGGCYFGPDVTRRLLLQHGLQLLI
ncbi:hypothetical protein INR49_022640, partial [Caranx melampygus]